MFEIRLCLFQHLKKHGLNKFQCIYCLFGACCIDQMLCHLSMEHFEYDSQCLKRSVKHDSTVSIFNFKSYKFQ